MAYTPHIRINWRGVITAGEEWSTSAAFAIEPPATNIPGDFLDDLASAAYAAFVEPLTQTSGAEGAFFFSNSVNLAQVDAYQIGTDGKAVNQGQFVPTTPAVGTGSRTLPNQVAVVASLRTGRPGRARRGRMYLPCLGAGVGSDGRLSPAIATAIATGVEYVFTQVAAAGAATNTLGPIVASGVDGENNSVTAIWVGNVFDTQRRRRSELQEAWSVVNYIGPIV